MAYSAPLLLIHRNSILFSYECYGVLGADVLELRARTERELAMLESASEWRRRYLASDSFSGKSPTGEGSKADRSIFPINITQLAEVTAVELCNIIKTRTRSHQYIPVHLAKEWTALLETAADSATTCWARLGER